MIFKHAARLAVLLWTLLYVTANPTPATSSVPTPSARLCPNAPKPSSGLKIGKGWEGDVVVGGLTGNPRGITLDRRGNLLVVERGKGITGHFVDSHGCVTRSKVVVDDYNLNHGLDISKSGNKLYATSREFAWSWDYNPATMTASNRKLLVTGMLTEKQLTRTIIASKHNLNYIMISISAGEGPDYESYDPTVGRAQVRAFDVTKLPPGGVAFNSTFGKVIGYGLTNAVGIAEDHQGYLHAGDNGGTMGRWVNGTMTHIGDNNPAEGFFKLSSPSKPRNVFAGYPYCFPVWDVDAIQGKTRELRVGDWLSSEPENGEKNDEWCADATEGPTFVLPPHSAPLDFKFGVGEDTNLYVSMHGNGFYDPSKGFKVVSVSGRYAQGGWSTRDSRIDPTFTEILSNDVTTVEQCLDGGCFRPLGIVWHPDGERLYVGSDITGEVFLLKRTPTQRLWGQCGGVLYLGPTGCAEGSKCQYRNVLYSQCVPL